MSMFSSLSRTVTTLFDTVNVVASQTARTVNTAASGLDMIDQSVHVAREKQLVRSSYELATFDDEYAKEFSVRYADAETQLQAKLSANPELKKHYETALDKTKDIKAEIAKKRAAREAK